MALLSWNLKMRYRDGDGYKHTLNLSECELSLRTHHVAL